MKMCDANIVGMVLKFVMKFGVNNPYTILVNTGKL